MTRAIFDGDNHKQRIAKVPRGPGVFTYDGSAVDHACEPTLLLSSKTAPLIGDDNMVVLDGSGQPVMTPAGVPVLDGDGKTQLGGPPKITRTKIETYRLWGVDFPEGEPVAVRDPKLAMKLRTLGCFDEQADEPEAPKSEPEAPNPPARKGPGRPPKTKAP